MADQGADWTSPSGGPGRGDEPPRFGERIPGWTPPSEAPAPAPGAQTYTPPPRPGLVPLHPLSFGQLLGGAFQVIRYNPRAAIPPALVVAIIQAALSTAITYLIGVMTVERVLNAANQADRTAILLGSAGLGGATLLAATVVGVVASSLLQGALTRVVADGVLGRRTTAREALRTAGRRFWPLVRLSILFGAMQLVLVVVLALSVTGLAVAFAGLADHLGIVLAFLVAVPIGLALAVVYSFFAVRLALAPSAIVLERKPVIASVRRSWILTRRAFWRTFGLIALVTIMVGLAAQIVALPISVVGGAVSGTLSPNSGGDLGSAMSQSLVSSIPATIVSTIVVGVGQVAQVGALVLVYLDRRMRTEGLDLELRRFAEQGGDDPYERIG